MDYDGTIVGRVISMDKFEKWGAVLAHVFVFIFMVSGILAGGRTTEENPIGEPGLYAAVLFLCVVATLVLNETNFGGTWGKRIRRWMAILGSFGSAALWLAAEAETSVFNWKLWTDLGIVSAILAILVVVTFGATVWISIDEEP